MAVNLKPGWRHARSATLEVGGDAGMRATFEPIKTFMMRGLGYGHTDWAHGVWKGPLAVEREDIDLCTIAAGGHEHLHIQAISHVTLERGGMTQSGTGILEQLILGPFRPLGLETLFGD